MRFGSVAIASLVLAFTAPATGQSLLQKGKDLLGGIGSSGQSGTELTSGEIGAGLKEALRVGTETVVAQLGRPDGFNADKAIHIDLPKSLNTVQSTLKSVGMSSMLDDLELKLNRAAEAATPRAKELFLQTINEMSLDDVKGIFEGPEDAATRYFQTKMSGPLADEMRPIVDSSLADVGAIQAYENTMGQYQKVPLVPDVKADLTGHVIEKGLDGIFHYVAREEAAIRQNPAKRTTDILKRVFSSGS